MAGNVSSYLYFTRSFSVPSYWQQLVKIVPWFLTFDKDDPCMYPQTIQKYIMSPKRETQHKPATIIRLPILLFLNEFDGASLENYTYTGFSLKTIWENDGVVHLNNFITEDLSLKKYISCLARGSSLCCEVSEQSSCSLKWHYCQPLSCNEFGESKIPIDFFREIRRILPTLPCNLNRFFIHFSNFTLRREVEVEKIILSQFYGH